MWDDGLVLYDARSDEAHRFDDITAEIFEELLAGPRLFSGLVTAMSGRLEVIADRQLEDLVAEILRILSDKSIVAPLS